MSYPLIVLLADGPTTTGPDFGKASPVGLLIVVLLLFAVFGLVWSMNRHLKKARDHFAAEQGGVGNSSVAVEDGGPVTRESAGESGG